ncbi:uncharacterized protein LOC111362962 [Spodoptera litura]|uniref:Uncharacterized protein LOC111362962 n=1 Tax=Spodoptera litura TaxID=69820 RepID=A0A9J7J580_SPOLT|nr:uncharacterized protein LOC111362962 [Spodoptera litura]
MPVTRSEGKAKKAIPKAVSEDTPTASATSADTESSAVTSETSRTGMSSTTGMTATSATSGTTTTQTSAAETSDTSGATPGSSAEKPSAPPSSTTTLKAGARSSVLMPPPDEARRHEETSYSKQSGKCKSSSARPPPSSKRGTEKSNKSKRILKAKEDLLKLQVELAAARLASMQAADSEDEEDAASLYTQSTVNNRVDDWLQNSETARPVLALTNEPHQPPAQPVAPIVMPTSAEEPTPSRGGDNHRVPAGGSTDLSVLAEAITKAISAAQRPRYIELPTFSGSHSEWLPFRAAYLETEKLFSHVENTNRLRKNLKGKAREAVDGLLITNTSPSEIIRSLELRFGRPESIAMTEIDNLRNLSRLTESPRDICIFATKISNTVATLKTLGCHNYMHNPEISKILIEKFTPTLKYRYYDYSTLQPVEDPCLLKIERFLRREAELCGPFALPEQVTPVPTNAPYKKLHKVNNVQERTHSLKCLVCEDPGHSRATECSKFKNMSEGARWEAAKVKHLCFRCLKHRNRTHSCKTTACGVNGCKNTHHRMLHYTKKETEPQTEGTEVINSAWTSRAQSFLKVIPVEISGPKGTRLTYALMDDGSTVTLIDDMLVKAIGATGPVDPLRLQTINEAGPAERSSRRVTVRLKGVNGTFKRITARTIKNLRVSAQTVPPELVEGCPHLKDILPQLTYRDARPHILIGQDNWHLLTSTEMRRGDSNSPVASLTPLGWVLHGRHSRSIGKHIDFVSHTMEQPMEDLNAAMKNYFELDALCIVPKRPHNDPEEQALRILRKNTVRIDGRFQTSLLWKSDDIRLPNNYENSLRRLENIEKKLDKDPALKKKYTDQMESLVSKGYAELAPQATTLHRTWYLPHFGVTNPMKPDKLRVVHDAAAKTKGVSLNEVLLKGPDLLQSLPGVVMRFRQHQIAVTADIAEMFMQVKLRPEDRDALRYLWRGEQRNIQPREYRMTSLIFGASSSPASAIFVKNLNAEQHRSTHPEAAEAIVHKHYVDDYLDSFRNIEDAVRIAKDVREVHRRGGFELKQWRSNSSSLLRQLGENVEHEDTEIYSDVDSTERVLGVIWRMHSDTLAFNLNFAKIPQGLIEGHNPTKREALKIVMSLFDPLGLASPVTIRAKQLLQEVWRRGTGWDDNIDEDLAEKWVIWLKHLDDLKNITIPRSYLGYSDAALLELHVFSDASESAYAAVLYWRTTSSEGEIQTSLIVAKAKVTPLKLTSIPRLELQAAVMGVRLAEAVVREHQVKPTRTVFWTDSKTVLSWIRSGSRSYKPYVAHRIAAIEEGSTVNDWRWVPTKLNVADDATRDVPTDFNRDARWYAGPDFLRHPEVTWPVEEKTPVNPTGEEKTLHVSTEPLVNGLTRALPDPARFSNWNRLRYTAARVLLFIDLLRNHKQYVHYRRTKKNKESDPSWRRPRQPKSLPKGTSQSVPKPKVIGARPVTAEFLRRAEELLMRASQQEAFPQELQDLSREGRVDKNSRISSLSIALVNGTLRLDGRINAAKDIGPERKNPMILDGDHPVVRLWVEHTHRQLHHAGVEATVNECRQQYWVLRLRPTTRTIIRRCLFCRLRTQRPALPKTGDLPTCRLAHHQRPFTYTGVDYFGPLSVTVGRGHQKRYVAIFTCLTTRAVHLEVAGSLSADSAVMAIRRMMARRGCPTEIWSDNGTNLKAADKELRQAIDAATAEETAKRTIAWRYIPPGAPFMGGAWERMVRSVKTALTATLHERHPSEEVLTTLLTEAEFTVNSRPLTHVSVSSEDPEALTPNHFLLGGPARVPQLGTLTEGDAGAASRASWRAAQRLADVFWQRWVREYLPELQHRREPHGRGEPVQLGDLVQVVDPNLPRNVWVRGRVVATYPGPDNIVRTVDLRTKGGVLRRPGGGVFGPEAELFAAWLEVWAQVQQQQLLEELGDRIQERDGAWPGA